MAGGHKEREWGTNARAVKGGQKMLAAILLFRKKEGTGQKGTSSPVGGTSSKREVLRMSELKLYLKNHTSSPRFFKRRFEKWRVLQEAEWGGGTIVCGVILNKDV